MVSNAADRSRSLKESKTCDLFERHGIDDVVVNRKESSLSRTVFSVG
jgi:hypothetical protein